MPKKPVPEHKRSRSVSLSLTAAEIFILEKLANRKQEDSFNSGNDGIEKPMKSRAFLAAQAYREAVRKAGEHENIHPYYNSPDSVIEIKSSEFIEWLEKRGWGDKEGDTVQEARYVGASYASLRSPLPDPGQTAFDFGDLIEDEL